MNSKNRDDARRQLFEKMLCDAVKDIFVKDFLYEVFSPRMQDLLQLRLEEYLNMFFSSGEVRSISAKISYATEKEMPSVRFIVDVGSIWHDMQFKFLNGHAE